MTTIAFSRKHGMIAADSRNTDSGGATFKVNKIERLDSGQYFLGSGHLYTIGLARDWAETGFDEEYRPEFGVLFCEQAEDYRFSCLIISEDGSQALLIDDEMHPQPVSDDLLAIGSGAAYALGAMAAGLSPQEAVQIAIEYDGNSGGPVQVEFIGERPKLKSVQ